MEMSCRRWSNNSNSFSFTCIGLLLLLTITKSHAQYYGPSDQPEAYFNGSSYIRLETTISLKRLTGMSFRTCAGGELISQQLNDNIFQISVNMDGLNYYAKTTGRQYKALIPGMFLNNQWHNVMLHYGFGNLTLRIDGDEELLANSTHQSDLLSGDLYNDGAVLIVGKHYNGCILEGPSINFNKSSIQAHSVAFTKCPIPRDTCQVRQDVKMPRAFDFCQTDPCLTHGVCKNEVNTYSCECSPRYAGKNCEIDLGNPCDAVPPVCKNGAVCIDDISGNFKCNCPSGFTGKMCDTEVKINPLCLNNPCQNGGVCQVRDDSVECLCPSGFLGAKCEVNVNECDSSPCRNGGLCIDGPNNFTCDCAHTGYNGVTCEENIDECQAKPCLNRGICYDTYGSYMCQCLMGYDGLNCEIKISDCKLQPCFNHGKCEEKNGRYECHCPPGYGGYHCEMELRAAGSSCDEHFCGPLAECTEISGVPTCACKAEYGGVYPNCVNSNCPLGTQFAGYYCVCKPGWFGLNCHVNAFHSKTSHADASWHNGGTFTQSCGDRCQISLDDCTKFACLNGGSCVETSTGYHCDCPKTHVGAMCERSIKAASCEFKPCQNNATCHQDPNGRDYTCVCLPGFEGNNCELDIDDCLGVTCPTGKICVDMINAHECQCPEGFTGDSCQIDIGQDPCGVNPCQNGECNPSPPGGHHNYTCTCASGYQGFNCDKDINECELPGVPICNNGICVNKEGSFQCYCKPGYTGERCNLDFDECLSQPCKNNATCINKVNNYECVCPPGYQGKDCNINIDECASNPCMMGSTCVDGINKFTCLCQAGLTGVQCEIDIDDCLSSPCLHDAICIDGLNMYTCNCTDTGYTGEHCEININDCVSNPCQNGALCIDLVKDYMCECFDGYVGKNCQEDINECESSPCLNYGVCLERSNATLYDTTLESNANLPAVFRKQFEFHNASGYECMCVPGVIGENCEINVNECDSNPCRSGTCVDKIGMYICECDEGFEGAQCEIDIDECEKYQPCVHGSCIDKRANYFCDCEAGYGGKNCSVELTGCRENPCQNNGTCKPYLDNETMHKFNCTCPHGFHGHTCERVTTMSLAGNSLLVVNTSRDEGHDIQFRFKTTLGDGFLALGKGSTYYILTLAKGRLNLHSSLLNKWDGVFVGSNLNDSSWQRVFVAINSSHLVLSANDEQTIYPINYNDNNGSSTSFPTTYFGGYPNNHRKLAHVQPFLVGCVEDIIVNGEWVLPDTQNASWVGFQNVVTGCHREPQCEPNPCHSGGHCTDLWSNFSCTCERPHLGYNCQYNYTAATFGYENITDSLVTVTATDAARRAIRSIVDISMFVRTRQSRGQIFYLGSALGSANLQNESYIAAQLEGGELLVRIQFNGTFEAYTVGGVKLNNGHDHLIQVIRNVTLVQVKLNGTEYFRKTISATGTLDAQVLFLGGQPQLRPVRQTNDFSKSPTSTAEVTAATGPAAVTTPLSMIHFKGIIQDVQISDGQKIMVVEFFPLQAEELSIPTVSFGTVTFDNATVLEGILSDDSCRIQPCHRNGKCINTWNDYRCQCPHGFKGKDCIELEFCELERCPDDSTCRNLESGYECAANATFDGEAKPLMYNLTTPDNKHYSADSIEVTYRTRSWGTVLFAKYLEKYFTIFIYHDEVVAEWNLGTQFETRRFRKEHFDGQWVTLLFKYKDSMLKGGFKEHVLDDTPDFTTNDFDFGNFNEIFTRGVIYIAGSDNKTFDYREVIKSTDYNGTSYVTLADTTTQDPVIVSNSVDFMDNTFPSYKIDLSRNSDQFKGCLSDIRIGRLLVPYYSTDELFNQTRPEEYFTQFENAEKTIGCLLCYEKDCYNNGRCIEPNSTYKCQCPDGYAADDCSIDINECEDNKCENNATCVDLIGKYECECQLGYDGTYCEHDIDECASGPCHNGGSCIDLLGMFRCECPEDYVGRQCEALRLITCDNQPCKDGSTCRNGKNEMTHNNFTCLCAEGMVGTLCDTPYCLVKSHGCEHDGLCNTTNRVPFCQCRLGYEGRHCEIDIDECVDDPCQNGGQCIDGVGRYTCNCTGTGYEGTNCEIDEDECTDIPNICGDLGKCVNMPGSYRCDCMNRRCGHQCKLDDPCIINPCEHGICHSKCAYEAAYDCECELGWAGKNCSETQIEAASTGNFDILYVIIPVVVVVLLIVVVVTVVLVNVARSKRATRGTYSPSAQEFCNPRVELDHVLKPPPEERLI
ncbi:protein crumbs-like [Atheta coriaria]|uniref:protein crumbs-like n=1 Tax=Dalotia coriaria TaxID=877792 RepID=UPI0031F34789